MEVSCDYLVIGSGLAGMSAALQLASQGRVALVTKRRLNDTATAWAQGGIASVISPDDSAEQHVRDTMDAGAGFCHRDVVQKIVEAGPHAIDTMVGLGVSFDRNQDDSYDLTREGGHRQRRILHAQDMTGREIVRALQQQVTTNNAIQVFEEHIAVDLVTSEKIGVRGPNRVVGCYILDAKTGNVQAVRASATLLATGGAGKVYLYTSNPDVATGDGIAMAYRAGAEISNLEFVQFHPTCLFHPRAKSFLISEALRGEGGVLRRKDGVAFMRDVHPLADLAPRDIVARAIDQEMKRTGDDCVYLDMTGCNPGFVASRFPNIHAACMALGIDMTQQPIPVVPAAHYMCGGVRTDVRGKTSVDGLWATGETACTGFHGANRLASNSLLEAAVVSDWAATDMTEFVTQTDEPPLVPRWDARGATDPDDQVVVSHNWDELRRGMWSYASIVRTDKRLKRGMRRVTMLRDEIHEYYWNFKLTPDLVELRDIATVAELILKCASARRESRGLHYNIDCVGQMDPADSVVKREESDTVEFARIDGT